MGHTVHANNTKDYYVKRRFVGLYLFLIVQHRCLTIHVIVLMETGSAVGLLAAISLTTVLAISSDISLKTLVQASSVLFDHLSPSIPWSISRTAWPSCWKYSGLTP